MIVVGSYERLLFGLSVQKDKSMKAEFIFPAHQGCIKSVASGGKYLASGGTDEIIKLYDLESKKELGHLSPQAGTINCLQFFSDTHLFAGCGDGKLLIIRTKDFETLKTLKGHKKAINSFAVHPSGKLGISVGLDWRMRIWDLVNGTCSFKGKTDYEGRMIQFNENGDLYFILGDSKVSVFDLNGTVILAEECKKILCATFIGDSIVFSGEDKLFHVISFKNKKHETFESGHLNRIKCIGSLDSNTLISTSSDGEIKLWNWKTRTELSNYKADCRLTCLTSQ